jgi:hypothetical protein
VQQLPICETTGRAFKKVKRRENLEMKCLSRVSSSTLAPKKAATSRSARVIEETVSKNPFQPLPSIID